MRRLPVYILIDTSGSMRGEPIESVKVGLEAMLTNLRTNPNTLESAWLSIITYDKEARQILPLTALDELQLPQLTAPESGPTLTGEALSLLIEKYDREVKKGSREEKGDWKPLLVIMTDGKPSDIKLYRDMLPKVKDGRFGVIVACAAGPKSKPEYLKEMTDDVLLLETLDSSSFNAFFKYIEQSIAAGSQSFTSSGELELPPPPAEVNILT